jgi:hypothetical protein
MPNAVRTADGQETKHIVHRSLHAKTRAAYLLPAGWMSRQCGSGLGSGLLASSLSCTAQSKDIAGLGCLESAVITPQGGREGRTALLTCAARCTPRDSWRCSICDREACRAQQVARRGDVVEKQEQAARRRATGAGACARARAAAGT